MLAFEREGDPRTSGRPDRAGNGAAMRIAPIGAVLADRSDDELASAVVDVSLLTHREPRALLGALGVAWVAARLAGEDGYPPARERSDDLLDRLLGWLEDRTRWLAEKHGDVVPEPERASEFAEALAAAARTRPHGWEAVVRAIEADATVRLGRPTLATDGFVLASVVTSIALVLISEESCEDTVVRAVNLGGDADTVGAMVGGMAGVAGPESIPERWRGMPGVDELEAWGRALGEGRPPDDLPDLVELERDLCRLIGWL